MSWETRVIDELCELKRAGLRFEQAWAQVLRRHPPSARQVGYRETLFVLEDGDAAERSAVEWLEWATREAWHGERKVLSHLKGALGMHEVQDAA